MRGSKSTEKNVIATFQEDQNSKGNFQSTGLALALGFVGYGETLVTQALRARGGMP
jgi:hypothetical protein